MAISMQKFKIIDRLLPDILLTRYILLHRHAVCTGKLRIVMFFIFCYFQQKLMPKFHWNSNSILVPFFRPFCSFEGNKNFSRKFFCDTFQFLNFYCCAKFRKKLMKRFWEKLVTDVCLDKPKFTGAPFPGIHSCFKSWNIGTLSMPSYSVVICFDLPFHPIYQWFFYVNCITDINADMRVTVVSSLNEIRLLTCSCSMSCLLNLNLVNETL